MTAFEKGERFAELFPNARTVASGLRVPAAVGDFMMLDAIRASGGKAVAGREAAIGPWMRRASSAEGISVCPETAVCFDVLEKLIAAGDVQPDETVVVFNTGAAPKYLEALPAELPAARQGPHRLGRRRSWLRSLHSRDPSRSPGAVSSPGGGPIPATGGCVMRRVIAGVVVAAALGTAAGADPPAGNSNALVARHKDKLAVTASTFWPGWPPQYVVDGNKAKSWFTARGDTITKKTKPWVQVAFPEDVTVSRVTVYGNREKPWEKGFALLAGRLDLLGAAGKVVASEDYDGTGETKDFDCPFKQPVAGVRVVRFTALGDEGDRNTYDDIAVGEIEIE